MPFVLLVMLALICMQSKWPEPFFGLRAGGTVLTTLGGVGVFWLLASFRTAQYCRLLQRDPGQRFSLLRQFQTRQKVYFYLLTGFFLLALYVLGWGYAVKHSWPHFWPGAKLAILLPFLAGMIGSWARFYDLEKTAHGVALPLENKPFPGRGAYLALQARFHFLLIVPPLFLMLILETIFFFVPQMQRNETWQTRFTLGFTVFAVVSIPWLLRLFLGLRPLPAGPFRDRLEGTARRLGFPCKDILVWNTRNCMANAFVTGILPWTRYIVLTDQLICELSSEEVEAVLGHEIGHIKHRHMFFYTLFLIISLIALGNMWEIGENLLQGSRFLPWIEEQLGVPGYWTANAEMIGAFPQLLFVGLFIFLVFGYLSRCCERQADIFGSRTVSCQVFINALEKVAVLNGIHRDRPGWLSSWRHPTIARRVDFLQRMQEDPDLESRFQRRVGLVKWGLTLVLGLVLGITLWLGEVLQTVSWENSAAISAERKEISGPTD